MIIFHQNVESQIFESLPSRLQLFSICKLCQRRDYKSKTKKNDFGIYLWLFRHSGNLSIHWSIFQCLTKLLILSLLKKSLTIHTFEFSYNFFWLNKFRMSKIQKIYVLWSHQKKHDTFFTRIYYDNGDFVSKYMQKHLLMVSLFTKKINNS